MADDELKKNVTKTGTATIGLMCKDGLIVAADKRISLGDTHIISHKKADKVFKLIDNIVVTTAGNASDAQYVLKLARAELKLKEIRTKMQPTVKEAASLFASILYGHIRQFSTIIAMSHFLIGGKDNTGFRLFEATPDGCIFEHQNYVTSGAFGSMFIWTLLKEEWREDMTIAEGKELVIKVLRSAIEFDSSVGEPLNIVIIDKNGAGEIEEYAIPSEDAKQKSKK